MPVKLHVPGNWAAREGDDVPEESIQDEAPKAPGSEVPGARVAIRISVPSSEES